MAECKESTTSGQEARQAPGSWHAGMLATVKSPAEIFATLDEDGMCAGMPFLPEMLPFCGQTFRVIPLNRIYIEYFKVRRIRNTVLLDGCRCDGTAHGGCQRRCMVFWNTAWLHAPDEGSPSAPHRAHQRANIDDPTRCQGQASVLTAATEPLNPYSPLPFLEDLRVGTFRLGGFLRMVGFELLKPFRERLHAMRKQRRPQPPPAPGATLDLQPGELVRVKSLREIKATLDADEREHGLIFSAEMPPFCGETYRVKHRVERLIDEKRGKMVSLKRTVVLESVTCEGANCRLCPRQCYWLWRESWLERVPEAAGTNDEKPGGPGF